MQRGLSEIKEQIRKNRKGNKKDGSLIIYIEEIEKLFKRVSYEEVEDFLDMEGKQNSQRIILIGITNEINFGQILEEKVKRQIRGLKCIVFNPYKGEQMLCIMKSKFKRIK
jgi:Cdc6-like AAA superfamily ATPase